MFVIHKIDNNNNKSKQKRGRKRKRTMNNNKSNNNDNDNMLLNSFHVLDNNILNDINNVITDELYENMIELYMNE